MQKSRYQQAAVVRFWIQFTGLRHGTVRLSEARISVSHTPVLRL